MEYINHYNANSTDILSMDVPVNTRGCLTSQGSLSCQGGALFREKDMSVRDIPEHNVAEVKYGDILYCPLNIVPFLRHRHWVASI